MLKPYNKAELSFTNIREIGQDGKNSNVHLVHDNQLDAEIVIKQIAKSRFSSITEYFSEAQMVYCSKHSNVVQVQYACEDADYIYIAMPHYSAGSLKKIINSRFLTVREVIKYSMEMLMGLNNIHCKGFIHFDIKPDNVLINEKNEALISDFGQSKPVNIVGLAEQDFIYPKQVPPEAFLGHRFDVRFDIYQVGVTLYRMLNGNEAFYSQLAPYLDSQGMISDRAGFKFAVTSGRFPDRDTYLEHVPKKIKEIVNKCLSINPDQRYKNCLELMNDLAQIDHSLDWQYTPTGSNKEWKRETSGKIMYLIYNGGRFEAKKVMTGTKRTYLLNDYCKESLTKTELYRFFKEE